MGFLCLLSLAFVGIGIPIPVFAKDRFESKKEQFEEEKAEDKDALKIT